MTEFKTRGYGIAAALKYCREGVDPARRPKVIASISPETIRYIESLKSAEWYPTVPMTEMFNAVIAACDGDMKLAEQDLIGCGIFAARDASNTFLRLVMRVLTPTLFAKKLPSLYARDNNKGTVEVDVTEDRVVAHFKDTLGFDHLAAMSAGWMNFALESMGKQVTSYKITEWAVTRPNVPDFKIEMGWKNA
ncbi:hypothetical protein AKJ09_04026 [Labilithrix luteola]|uniref:Uncharacterized protein n=1 Tax=Labilithrix luteola TaxID=1391654 RepID=A0A0K1PV11_9BACT|nr:hypothetical protein [Labilithrix luteola]AKU97362.1 hypothetical protein AKJ09_04026 [Labilithrix luteola]